MAKLVILGSLSFSVSLRSRMYFSWAHQSYHVSLWSLSRPFDASNIKNQDLACSFIYFLESFWGWGNHDFCQLQNVLSGTAKRSL